MSDNVTFQTAVTATPPNATTVATDLIGGAHYQIAKLAYGDDGTAYILGHGTPMPVGTLPGGTVIIAGTAQMLGTFQPLAGSVHLASRLPGTADIGTIAGTVGILGTVQPLAGSVHLASRLPGTVDVGTIAGTISALGTFQPLAGSAHIANTISGTVQVHGTVPIGTVAGTVSVLGTTQPLAGSVHVANTISGTVQVHGTVPVGTVAGTVSALGTFQPLAGSAHLATNLAGGTVVSVGSAAHGAAADARPVLLGGFGSSGTQAAVDDGDAVRAWFDLNGRLQVRGTIDSLPATLGTVSLNTGGTMHVGSVQRIAGTVDIGTIAGTISVGTIASVRGTVDVGTVRGTISVGTIAGTVAVGSIAGTVSVGTIAGTVSIGTVAGTVRIGAIAGTLGGGTVVAQPGGFGSYFGTAFTAAVGGGTLIVNPGQGTRWRIFDITVSMSATGTLVLQESSSPTAGTAVFGPMSLPAYGGWQFNSARGIVARGTNLGLYGSVSTGTASITINYTLEN